MNMPNKFVTNLTEDDITKLERLWQTSPKFRIRNRASAILLSYRRVSREEIAKICQIHRETVSHWIDDWERESYQGLADKERSGRPPILDKKEEAEVLEIALQEPRLPHRKMKEMEEKVDKSISRATLKNS